jgi:hypothetical protein
LLSPPISTAARGEGRLLSWDFELRRRRLQQVRRDAIGRSDDAENVAPAKAVVARGDDQIKDRLVRAGRLDIDHQRVGKGVAVRRRCAHGRPAAADPQIRGRLARLRQLAGARQMDGQQPHRRSPRHRFGEAQGLVFNAAAAVGDDEAGALGHGCKLRLPGFTSSGKLRSGLTVEIDA